MIDILLYVVIWHSNNKTLLFSSLVGLTTSLARIHLSLLYLLIVLTQHHQLPLQCLGDVPPAPVLACAKAVPHNDIHCKFVQRWGSLE